MKNRRIFYLSLLVMALGFASSAGAVTYRLQRVTSVEKNQKYVFEQAGYVMSNNTANNALLTTDDFVITGLTGSEPYVWELKSADEGFKMYNSKATGIKYLYNSSSSLSFPSSGNGSVWSFSFHSDGTALISTSSRYLAFDTNTSHQYKCYASGYLALYPHSIVVYKLVKEVKTSPNLAFASRMVNVFTGDEVNEPVLTSDGVDVTYTSSNPKVATVNSETGDVTVVGPGRTLITASSEATDIYDAGEATYTLLVMDGDGTEAKPYSAADFSTGYMPSVSNGKYYFQGYIVGYYKSGALTTLADDNSNVALGSDRDGANTNNTVAVILGDFSSTFGLKADSKNMGKRIKLYGCVDSFSFYQGKIGIDKVESMSFAGSYPVTISNYKYATYRTSEKLDFTDTGVSAYTAAISGDHVVLTKISDGVVEAGKGVVLYSETAGTFDIPVTTAEMTVGDTGLSISDGTSATKEAVTYVLGKKNDIVGFYRWVGAESLPAGRVYLNGSVSTARDYLEFTFDEETTGMSDALHLNKGEIKTNVVYDLQGRRVAQPARGLYIVNGKKVVIK